MENENQEELNESQEETQESQSSEQAPAEEQSENSSEESNVVSKESDEENQSEEKEEEETVTVPKKEFEQLKEEKENYKQGMLSAKGKGRVKELSEEETQETETGNEDNAQIKTDYNSKRADVLADFEDKLRDLPDDQYKMFKQHLTASETVLLNNSVKKSSYVARKHITDMLEDGLSYVNFKFNKPAPQVEVEETQADIGSTKTIRRTVADDKVSDDDKEVSGKSGLTPERVKELKDKGYKI